MIAHDQRCYVSPPGGADLAGGGEEAGPESGSGIPSLESLSTPCGSVERRVSTAASTHL